MAIDGHYIVELVTPGGCRTGSLDLLVDDAGLLSGRLTYKTGLSAPVEGLIIGDVFAFSTDVVTPKGPIVADIRGRVRDSHLLGHAHIAQGDIELHGTMVEAFR